MQSIQVDKMQTMCYIIQPSDFIYFNVTNIDSIIKCNSVTNKLRYNEKQNYFKYIEK